MDCSVCMDYDKMTHSTELEKIVKRLIDSGWQILEVEQEYYDLKGRVKGDDDILASKINYTGLNLLLGEEKSGAKMQWSKATKQLSKALTHLVDYYNPDRIFAFHFHKQIPTLIYRADRCSYREMERLRKNHQIARGLGLDCDENYAIHGEFNNKGYKLGCKNQN